MNILDQISNRERGITQEERGISNHSFLQSRRDAVQPQSDIDKSPLRSFGPDDALHGLSLSEKLEFYKRLAKRIKEEDSNSLSALLLEHWIFGKGHPMRIPNARIKNNKKVKDQLSIYREIFLSKRKTNWTKNNRIVGVVPKLEKGQWDGISDLPMNYQGKTFNIISLPEYASLLYPIWRGNKSTLTEDEKIDLDLFTSLHMTSLVSEVIISGTRISPSEIKVSFKKWKNYIEDNYNWDNDEHLTLPNPDFNNKYSVLKPVRPQSKKVRIYHNHALELERMNLAHSFDFTTEPWEINVQGENISYNKTT